MDRVSPGAKGCLSACPPAASSRMINRTTRRCPGIKLVRLPNPMDSKNKTTTCHEKRVSLGISCDNLCPESTSAVSAQPYDHAV